MSTAERSRWGTQSGRQERDWSSPCFASYGVATCIAAWRPCVSAAVRVPPCWWKSHEGKYDHGGHGESENGRKSSFDCLCSPCSPWLIPGDCDGPVSG